MEITLRLQYRIPPEAIWCRLEVAKQLNAVISDAKYITPIQVEFTVKRTGESSHVMFDTVVEEIKQLVPDADLKMAYMIRTGGRLPVVMYDSTYGRVLIHGYG